MGYNDIYVADPNQARLTIAKSLGARAHPVGDTSKRFALIVECSGAHAARNIGIELVLPRGALVLVGENAAPWTIEEGKVFRRKDFYMIRTFYFPIADFEPNIALLRRYKDDYRVLVDGEFGLADLPDNFARFAQRRIDQARAGGGLAIMASISIRNLVKRYGNLTVIPDLNLEIADHEFVVFVGPSGCGKSTLLRIIAGLEPISAGDLYIGDRRVNGVPAAQRDIAMVFQDYALYPHMRVYDNMSFALELRGTPKAEIDARVKRAAALAAYRSLISTASRRNCPAASASAWRWGAPSCAIQRLSCSTSRCPISTPSCAGRCVPRSRRCRRN